MCLFCMGYVAFETKMEMHAHVKTVHQFDKISCPLCDLVFEKSDFQKLTMHIVNVHNTKEKIAKKPTIQCASCRAELTNKKAYADHIVRQNTHHPFSRVLHTLCPELQLGRNSHILRITDTQ